jgi:hypothetical protein
MPNWRTSSFSTGGNCVEVAWRKSSFTGGSDCVEVGWRTSSFTTGGNCVEVAHQAPAVLIRDSKTPDGPVLDLPFAAFAQVIAGLRVS